VVVIGGGHAGVEAAAAAARLGVEVLLLTLDTASLVRLSCNPAIGGIGKGHLVREIDALGGVMGLAADAAGTHFRLLNRSRGPAVQGPRAQQDYDRYPAVVQRMIEADGRIALRAGEAVGLRTEAGRITAVVTADGWAFPASAVVLTTGTFLRGLLFQGESVTPGGRAGEPPSNALSAALATLGIRLERFKTGTPPRLWRRSLDPSRFEEQPGDEVPVPFSFLNLGEEPFRPGLPQLSTWLAYSNDRVHALVRAGLDRSPLYTGKIRAKGPRYCPSFEDKVVRFADRERHLLHLEPMGIDHPWLYVNGLSTSLPPEIQAELVASIEGLEGAEVARWGYAVEYDYAPPTQLLPTLEVRAVPGLFLAGQICGTTGYEEAAGLGLVAGTNAALAALDRESWVPDRLESYLGVMVDDLTTAGVLEPYRMFTSRAELRLSLSADSADRRLTAVGERLGLVPASRAARSRARWERIERAQRALDGATSLRGARRALPADRIRRGDPHEEVFAGHLPPELQLPAHDSETLAGLLRYRGYLEREQREADRLADAERVRIPGDFMYDGLSGLSTELRERLSEVRPGSLGQAARIPGMTPAALGLLAAAIGQRARAVS
jgi:tRNA uridine 5-carboxymethylaminomethyl modification enzyme